MNSIGMSMFAGPSTMAIKPELNGSDIQLCVPLAMQQEKFPKWILDFNMKCLEICGTSCPEKLDEIMELYIKQVKREMVYYGPDNASVVVNRMSRTMLFFYLKYVDIKEYIVFSQWNEHMEDLLSLYCQLQLRSAQRGKDSDIIICSKIMYALWTYLNNDEKHMLHVLLKTPNIKRKHKKILDPIFRKLLVGKKKPECDLEYIRKVFAFKLWKRLYGVDEKKAISELAFNELQQPKSFIANIPKYNFLPRDKLDYSDIHQSLITGKFEIEKATHDYFEYLDNKNKRIFDNDYILPEKKSFMSEMWNSVSAATDNFDEISTTSDTFTLERIKQEVVNNVDTDDDCVIVEPVIDLTADENEPLATELHSDEVPQWCSNLIEISEECVPATPPHSITDECVEKDVGEEQQTAVPLEKPIEIIDVKPVEPPPLEVKISNVRRARLDSDNSADLSLPDTLSSSTSEDNSHGFREITSTSHPVQEVPAKSSYPSPEHVSGNYEQVDSTSNLNENEEDLEEVEALESTEPTVQAFILERTVVSGLVCSDTLSQVPPTNATVSNVDFEQFACEQTQKHTPPEQISASSSLAEGSVNDLNIVSVKHVSEENIVAVAEKDNAFSLSYVSNGVVEEEEQADEFDVCSEDNIHQSKISEDDNEIQSPAFEPITQNDCMNYVKGLGTSQYYENFYKESISKAGPTTTTPTIIENRKRKNCDIAEVVQTTTKRANKEQEQEQEQEQEEEQVITEEEEDVDVDVEIEVNDLIPEDISLKTHETSTEPKERRVPASGEKVCRFAGPDLWEPVFTDKFKMSKIEYELFNPSVLLRKLNPQHFIPNYNEYTSLSTEDATPYIAHNVDHSHRSNLHLSRFKTKGILEYQQYTKASSIGGKPRARIIQINPAGHSKELSSTITTLKKKKGTGSPDLNINFTLPKLESLSLNSSFQHHFCTDISVCTSATKCFSDPSSMSTSTTVTDPNCLSQSDPHSPCCFVDSDVQTLRNIENESHMQVQIGFKRPVCDMSNFGIKQPDEPFEFKRPKIEIPPASTSTSTAATPQIIEPKQEVPPTAPILPAEVPYWHEIDSSEPLQKFDHSQACPNLLVNINLDQSEQEIHLPIKKRRVSSFKVEIKDELSYPATPMISIAELENIERNKARSHNHSRPPFKTPAELKEVPPIHPSYMYNINTVPPMTTVTDIYNISHTYSMTPTINYHVTNEPIISAPHYHPLPTLQPIILPVSRAPKANWEQPSSSSAYNTYRKRRQAASRKETATNRTVQKSKSHKTKIS